MTFDAFVQELQNKQLKVQEATQDLHRFVGEHLGVNLAAPIGVEAVAMLAARIMDMKSQATSKIITP